MILAIFKTPLLVVAVVSRFILNLGFLPNISVLNAVSTILRLYLDVDMSLLIVLPLYSHDISLITKVLKLLVGN